jgi:hypothetical protein
MKREQRPETRTHIDFPAFSRGDSAECDEILNSPVRPKTWAKMGHGGPEALDSVERRCGGKMTALGLRTILSIQLLSLIFVSQAHAHPVSFHGATGIMTWNQPFLADDWITYSFRPDAAVAARHMRFDVPGGERLHYYGPQLDYLVKRWNELHSQANIYVYGSYGALSFQDRTHGAGLAGIEADAESRKHFILLKYEKMWGDLGPDFYHGEFRLGIAPYEAEFNEVASWLMLQYQWHPMLTREWALTPLIRLFYKNVLFETGASTDGDWMLNFMFHF